LIYALLSNWSGTRRITATLAEGSDGGSKDPANVSVNIQFADGSVGTLVYTTVGHKDCLKERLEVFAAAICAGRFQLPGILRVDCESPRRKQTKVSAALLQHFIQAVRGKTALEITACDGVRATTVRVKALESIRTGHVCRYRCERNQITSRFEGRLIFWLNLPEYKGKPPSLFLGRFPHGFFEEK